MIKQASILATVWLALAGMTAAHAQNVRILGRTEPAGPNAFQIQWPGSGFETRFTGGTLTAAITDTGQNWLGIEVDGKAMKLPLREGTFTYTLFSGAKGDHVVRVTRRTGVSSGLTTIASIKADGPLAATPAPTRRILAIGDSITAGYGADADTKTCPDIRTMANPEITYAALTARYFGADLHTIAIDGRGVSQNYGGGGGDLMGAASKRALPNDPKPWAISAYTPQVVIVNLGVNDFTSGDPGDKFDTAYDALLADIRRNYPQAWIVGAFGSMLYGADYNAARDSIKDVVARRVKAGDARLSFLEFTPPETGLRWGCDWHPARDAHRNMAETLERELETRLGWTAKK
jgi:lysophospholipase L1-like esterase